MQVSATVIVTVTYYFRLSPPGNGIVQITNNGFVALFRLGEDELLDVFERGALVSFVQLDLGKF